MQIKLFVQLDSNKPEYILKYPRKKDHPKEIKHNTENKTKKNEFHIVLVEISQEYDGKYSTVHHQIEESCLIKCDQQLYQKEDDRYY